MSQTAAPTFEAPSPEHLATLFPGYAITGLLACGGMGAVYQAVQLSLDRHVAIKILPRELSADMAFREQFQAEARIMARLNHPNLISVFDSGEVDGMLFIVMEYVEGESLYHASYGIRVDGRESARLVAAICSGLAHAHEAGILHRDIKPANILLTPKADPKIGDFGLARPMETQEGVQGVVFGTPHYTAPEVVTNPYSVDARADIFSVGVVLHQLLTGNVPAADPRTASAIAGCDPRFDEIILKATHPSPIRRYSSAAEMAADLHRLSNSIATPAVAIPVASHVATPTAPLVSPATASQHRAPTRRHIAPRAQVAVVKKSNGGLKVLALLSLVAAGAYVHIKKPGGVDFSALFGGAKAAETQPAAGPGKEAKPFIANMQGGSMPQVPTQPTHSAAPAPAANVFGTTEPPKN
jgi:serine/threonine protein kinase